MPSPDRTQEARERAEAALCNSHHTGEMLRAADVLFLADRVAELEALQDASEARLSTLETALREISDIPSQHDLLTNAVARATYTIAIIALAEGDNHDSSDKTP